jgi:hypothetical protein
MAGLPDQFQLRTNLAPNQATAPQLVAADGSLSAFSIPANQVFVVTNVSIQFQATTGQAQLVDVSLTQVTPAAATVKRWSFTGSTLENIERRLGGVAFSTPFMIASGALSSGRMTVNLWGFFAAAPSPVLELMASLVAENNVTPQVVNADGSLTPFSLSGQVLVVNGLSIQRPSTVGVSELLVVSIMQTAPDNGTVLRWSYIGTTTQNIERNFSAGIALSTAFTLASSQPSSAITVNLYGSLVPKTKTLPVQLLASVGPGNSTTTQQVMPDASFVPFSIPTNQYFIVTDITLEREVVVGGTELIDIALVQQAPAGTQVNRWAFTGNTLENIERQFLYGITFSAPFAVASGTASANPINAFLWGYFAGVPGSVQVTARAGPGGDSALQTVNPDGSFSPFSVTAEQAFLMTDVSCQRATATGAAPVLDVRFQQMTAAGSVRRWAFTGLADQNVERRFDSGGISFSTALSLQSGSDSSDEVIVNCWGLFPGSYPVPVQLQASASSAAAALPQVVNPDGSLATLAAPGSGNWVFSVTDISIQRQTVDGLSRVLDVTLWEETLTAGVVNRWTYIGNTAGNAERSLLGLVFSASGALPFSILEVGNDSASQDGVVVRLWGYFVAVG